MTAQKASYGMDYLNHAQPKDVLRWIVSGGEPLINFNFGCVYQSCIKPKTFIVIRQLQKGYLGLTIPCHQFAASVVGRLEACVRKFHNFPIELFSYDVERNELNILFEEDYLYTFSLPINPFHGMKMPDGSPRTSCTREEFEEWSKELDA